MLNEIQAPLVRLTLDSLRQSATSNHTIIADAKLHDIAQSIGTTLTASEPNNPQAYSLGIALGEQGLSLSALLDAQAAALALAASLDDSIERSTVLKHTTTAYGEIIKGLVAANAATAEQQRVQIEQTLRSTVDTRLVAEEALRNALRELSTPIIPVATGILVLPLVGTIDSRRANEINEHLLEGIATHQAEIVIIDITGVPMMDTSTANLLLMTARAANLLGSRIVICGIGAEIAQTITHLGVDLRGLTTLSNLQASIAYALGEMGLGIKPL
ncbi:MAG: STAS domain-containing protein [Roseiflexaceae bacterium]|nr:STAS domain-containing protein [Roseiflexaceae bacterium]